MKKTKFLLAGVALLFGLALASCDSQLVGAGGDNDNDNGGVITWTVAPNVVAGVTTTLTFTFSEDPATVGFGSSGDIRVTGVGTPAGAIALGAIPTTGGLTRVVPVTITTAGTVNVFITSGGIAWSPRTGNPVTIVND